MSGKHLKRSRNAHRHFVTIIIQSLDNHKKTELYSFSNMILNWILNEHSFKLYMPEFIIIKNYIG